MARWRSKLSRPLTLHDGTRLVTLGDARKFILEKLPERDHYRPAWQTAIARMMEAAEQRGSISDATDAIDAALFMQAMLKL
jgi:hypothetical protein